MLAERRQRERRRSLASGTALNITFTMHSQFSDISNLVSTTLFHFWDVLS